MDNEQIQKWVSDLSVELESLEHKINELTDKKRMLQHQYHLLIELLATIGDDSTQGSNRVVGHTLGSRRLASNSSSGQIGEQVRKHAREILREHGAPLHISELHRSFRENGYPIPGAGRPENITVHIASDHEIVSPKRGVYSLNLAGEPVTRSTNKSRSLRERR